VSGPSPARPIRQYPASAISSSARDRFTTRTHGTTSSAPEALLATVPDSGGAWRSWVTIAQALKAAAERMIAPTLCGSVTWSSTTTGRSRIGLEHVFKVHVFQRVAFQHQPLVRRVARDQPGKIGGRCPLDREIGRQFAVERSNALARRPQLAMIAFGVEQRGFHRMAAPQPHRAGAGPARPASALHSSGASAQGTAWLGLVTAVHDANPWFIELPCQPPH
jgi:hypothetical protein